MARHLGISPLNPNGLGNASVLRLLRNGRDLMTFPRDRWVIDFNNLTEKEAALFELPFEYAKNTLNLNVLKTGAREELCTGGNMEKLEYQCGNP